MPAESPASVVDGLLPAAMARRAEEVGEAKVALPAVRMFALAVLAGAFIALGAVFATTVTAGGTGAFGVTRLIGGVAFSLGLVLVVVGGAELFTGNNMIIMAWAGGRVSSAGLLRNWAIVYIGNLVGAVATAALVVASGHHAVGGGVIGDNAIAIAEGKLAIGWGEAFFRGVLANALVCLAIWLTFSARTVVDRIIAIVGPITAFVAAGFEHSIANMYFVPAALILEARSGAAYWEVSSPAARSADLGWARFLSDNLVPVTLGNIVGGGVLVAGVYWFVYLRTVDGDAA